ncbi:aspartyl-tRNA(Asn)/glutamyl-tRNA(Gln) amidotransferase subunit A [Rhodobium orientis]|uniref:Asp-tRNA(Asn)/Glu-tRNA(Gln) amidotransferase GatCAB subunit A n=1 Tax=Rhodobium orientis TaxID=34017 RepID=A0A327JK08_9HYPH|nr:AtzE family amidohydrolase [Rhodobium orientis]MBB4305093.1 aspartyl-tRNA(Asn)/glutamyl-tRNA(Gln) amidotransferase subunit A [Rhodobium orientis]MBK5952161.1 AtzE family amidohydrolase [Rhodobium orientis]RAI25623.1 Asp-tRNA(Asn)/Glu-tRNA(Gln) amidotransferase GatCAB subunit A [Rhodobium orientis]
MHIDPLYGTVEEIAEAVRLNEVSAEDMATLALQAVDAINPRLGAFTDVTTDRALAEATEIDAMLARGEPLPPLAGVPVAVKNLYDVAGVTTRAGSRINRDNPPADADAVLVARLKRAGALLIGTLNMDEYAFGFTGENAHDGACRNPHATEHMSGGSSAGAGASIAAAMVAATLGTDTNGSIRVPASFCGVFGLKPTYGALSRAGVTPLSPSLDHTGPLARSARDLALLFDVLRDAPMTAPGPSPTMRELDKGADGLRIAVAGGWFREKGFPEAHAAVEKVAKALDVSDEVELPEAGRARAAAYVLTAAEGGAYHLERLRERAADFDPDTRDRFLAGALTPSAWVTEAQRFRRWFRDRVSALFAAHDIILAPATPCHAPKIGQKTFVLDGEEVPTRPNIGLYTQPISFIGLPVVAVPVWLDGARLPIGVQVIAAPDREDLALRVAAQLQEDGIASAPVASII